MKTSTVLLHVGLGLLLAVFPAAAAERAWTGAAGSGWYNPANGSPPGAPDPADTLNLSGGSPNVSFPFTLPAPRLS